jgi:hypothetical protein
VEIIFLFAKRFLSKKGRIIWFYPDDFRIQKESASFVDVYEFTIS